MSPDKVAPPASSRCRVIGSSFVEGDRVKSVLRWVVLVTLAAVNAGVALAGGPQMNRTYTNPIQVPVADPFVLKVEDTYHLYGTRDPDSSRGVPVYTSPDLVHWRYRGLALERTADSWGRVHFWGPEVVVRGDRFYMYFNASPNKTPDPPLNMHLAVAVSDSPLGPFKELKAPLYGGEPGDEAIDQNIFTDKDGKQYCFFTEVTKGRNDIRVAPLSEDGLSLIGTPKLCLKPEQPWESRPWEGHVVIEGAYVIRRDDVYYLLYTANHFLDVNYAIGHATAPHPMGPWTRYHGNPILERSEHIVGPGNGMLVESPDGREMFIVYHVHQTVHHIGYRQLAIDRVRFEEQASGPDRMIIDGPTHTPQPLPSGAEGWPVARGDSFSGDDLDRRRWTIVHENADRWKIANGRLVITTSDCDMARDRADIGNLFLQPAPSGDFEVSTRVDFTGTQNYEMAFLTIWQDYDNHLRVGVGHIERPCVFLGTELDSKLTEAFLDRPTDGPLWLRVQRSGRTYTAAISGDGKEWVTIGAPWTPPLHTVNIGLSAIAPGSGRQIEAAFEGLRVETK